MIMRVYIVRHGQSTSNAMEDHRLGDARLTSLGIEQSKKIAARAAKIPFEVIISSDFTRALQTAEIIRKRSPRKIISTPLLREESHPSELVGRHKDDPEVVKIKKLLIKNRNKPQWHFSDEENFFDLKKRIGKGLRFLEGRKEKNILVVGHTFSTRMLVSLMVLGNALTPDMFQKIRDRVYLSNAGITVCDFVGKRWQLITWNDSAHLG